VVHVRVGSGAADALVAAGAEILVAGTAVYGATDAKAAVAQLRAAALSGVKV
jgi:pentose-5-phosphate-3-epimerase